MVYSEDYGKACTYTLLFLDDTRVRYGYYARKQGTRPTVRVPSWSAIPFIHSLPDKTHRLPFRALNWHASLMD